MKMLLVIIEVQKQKSLELLRPDLFLKVNVMTLLHTFYFPFVLCTGYVVGNVTCV